MTTPTLRATLEAIAHYPLASGQEMSAENMREMACAALAAQPELPEPVADVDEYGKVKWRGAVHTETTLYTAAQLQQAVEQASSVTDDDRRYAAYWKEHVEKLDALVTYCPTCCQGFAGKKELTRDEVIFESGRTVGKSQAKREPMSVRDLAKQFTKEGFKKSAFASQHAFVLGVRAAEAHHNIGGKV